MAEEKLTKKSKDKFYRGKNVNELKDFDTREFAKLVKSRARRALLRNYDVIAAFIKKCEERSAKGKPIKTHDRAMVIVPAMVGKNIGIYNGKEFIRVEIVEEMLGHRLGEFSPTRKQVKHTTIGTGASKSTAVTPEEK
jgi:small subunit ribosomal protein S19